MLITTKVLLQIGKYKAAVNTVAGNKDAYHCLVYLFNSLHFSNSELDISPLADVYDLFYPGYTGMGKLASLKLHESVAERFDFSSTLFESASGTGAFGS